MKNQLIESIKRYKKFLKKSKFPFDEKYYKDKIKERERILSLIKNNRFSSKKFDELDTPLRWDVYPLLKNVNWICKFCGR